jgi:hypothetical protein
VVAVVVGVELAQRHPGPAGGGLAGSEPGDDLVDELGGPALVVEPGPELVLLLEVVEGPGDGGVDGPALAVGGLSSGDELEAAVDLAAGDDPGRCELLAEALAVAFVGPGAMHGWPAG